MALKAVLVIGLSMYLNVWFSSIEAACLSSGADVIQMCQSGTISGSVLYIDVNTTTQGTGRCSCTATLSREGQVDIYAITGSVFSSCAIRVDVFQQMPSTVSNIYSQHCLQDQGYTGSVPANTDVMYNLNGPGTIDACLMMRTFTTGSTITISCSPKIHNATPSPTAQAPTTQAPTTQAPTTQTPTTQAPTTQAPTTQAPATQAPTTRAPPTQAPTTQAPTSHGTAESTTPTAKAPTTPVLTTPSRGPTIRGTATSFSNEFTPTAHTTPQTSIDLTTFGWIMGVIGLFIIILVLSIVLWFNRHAFRGRHVKPETEAQDVYSSFQERSDENVYQSIDISHSMSDRVYYNVPEAVTN